MTFSEEMLKQIRSENLPPVAALMLNNIRITSWALMIDKLRNTIDHVVAGTAPECDFDDSDCEEKMVLDLSNYEWRCPVCDE